MIDEKKYNIINAVKENHEMKDQIELPKEDSIMFLYNDEYKIGKTYLVSTIYGSYYVTRLSDGFRIAFSNEYILNKAKRITKHELGEVQK